MHVALAQDEVLLAPDLDLEAGVGREQHPVADLDGAHGRARGDDLRPHEPPVDVGGGRDQDPRPRLAVARLRSTAPGAAGRRSSGSSA